MNNLQTVHIVGIGGIGTSAAAKWYVEQGAHVTGSDMHESAITKELQGMGVKISFEHAEKNVKEEVELIIFSPAVPDTNPERQKAAALGIRQLSYPHFLGEVAKKYRTIAVSGTNGKSTTTAMIAKILIDAGYDPLVFLGTKSPDLSHGNLHNGKGVWAVIEACEYREGMNNIQPNIAVLTNIEADHLDYYRDLDHIKKSFEKWISAVHPFDGAVLVNADDEHAKGFIHDHVQSFTFDHRTVAEGIQSFIANHCREEMDESIPLQLSVPGAYNASNAAAACAAARIAGISRDVIKESLAGFKGTWRRMEHIGSWNHAEVYSDYAHHPTAVKGAIAGMKELHTDKKIAVVFEPHQHARTEELFDDFAAAFDDADALVMAKIYRVEGRTSNDEVTSEKLADVISARGGVQAVYAADYDAVQEHLKKIDADIIIFMGAGTIDDLARKLV